MRAVASGFLPREKGLLSATVAYSPNISSGSLIRSFHSLRLLQISQPGEQLQVRQDCAGRLSSSVAYSGRGIQSFAGAQAVAAQASALAAAEYAVLEVDGFADSAKETNAAGGAKNVFSQSGKGEIGGELDISKIGISPEIVDALAKRNISHLFPIQRAVFEPAMQGRDLIARAKTGTGKTLAFGIPILNYITRENGKTSSMRRRGKVPLALVLAPTRELAKQVEKEFHDSAPKLETICVYGGVSILAQQQQLQKGVDVAVGTPGRIIDLLERGSLNLREVKYVVLDEADQMLAIGFAEDVEKILTQLPAQRQSMLFSATMPDWVKNLSRKFLQKPVIIDLVGEKDEKLAEGIKIYSVSIASSAKRSILNDLITVYAKGGKTIVFTQTKRDADDVATAMSKILGCAALHGDITQHQREKTLDAFRDGRFTVLVATDVAARGLDIPNVDLVIHYEIPNCPEGFVHRSGRTGRAGKEGTTILMHTQMQRRTVQMIERDVGCKFVQISPPNAEDVLKSSSDYAARALQKVHPDVREAFLPTARKLSEQQGPAALAAALAYLSGFTRPIASRSLLTHEQGWMTLRITGSGQGPPFSSSRSVMGVLSRIYSPAADRIGKICMLDDSSVDGAVFDLPEDVAKALLSMKITSGEHIDAPKQLPRIVEDLMPSDNYGKPFLKHSGGRGFGDRNSGVGGFGQRAGGYGRSEAFVGRERKWEPSNNMFDKLPSGSRGRDRSFSGNCFACGQPGHYTLDCPTRQEKRY